jgi:hypothetical protein
LQPAAIVGKGSYGVVISATDRSSGQKVAVKRIKPYCGDEWEARHTLREVRLMRLLGVHPNVVSLTNLWTRDEGGDSELYLAMELMDSDLHQIIQSKQQLSEPHFQVLMKQLLLGVQAMHRLGVLHRDLKPGKRGSAIGARGFETSARGFKSLRRHRLRLAAPSPPPPPLLSLKFLSLLLLHQAICW